jgi:hypothetical protein
MAEPGGACAAWQEHIAAWCVAQLGPDEEVVLVAHLRVCPACRADADSLLAVAAVSLGAAPGALPWHLAVDEAPPTDLADRIVAAMVRERRLRWPVTAAIGAALAAIVVVVGVVALRAGGRAVPDGEAVVFPVHPPGVTARAVVVPEARGSLVSLTATGLEPDITYALWLTAQEGGYADRVPAGTFRPDRDGRVRVRLRSALPSAEVTRVWATTPDGTVTLDTKIPADPPP